jgi:hypothetical protein
MRSLRILLSMALAIYMTGAGPYVFAQESDASPFSITVAPVQFADVKGNVGKFEALNWMPNGADAGVSDISFVKDINKNISLDVDGSVFPKTDNNTGHLTLTDGDIAFLKVDYNAFRKYYDNTGGQYRDTSTVTIPASEQGVKANSPDLQLDISYFKLEAGLGPISDPFLDISYQHNSKDGDKSLLQWAPAYEGATYRKIGPSWESVDDTQDIVTLKEKKDVAGVTIKGEQTAEVDYNHSITYMQYLNAPVAIPGELNTEDESPDAKLFGAGVRFEKWMSNDNTFAGFGYHYNHTHDTDLMQNLVQETVNGIVTPVASSSATQWNFSTASEDDHVLTGNLNTNLTSNLAFIVDGRYEHLGSEGSSTYVPDSSTVIGAPSTTTIDDESMENHQDHEGEHVALRYSGISHTSLYAESDMEQERNLDYESFDNTQSPVINPTSTNFWIDRLGRTQKNSWDLGGKIIPNRFFTFTSQVKQSWEDDAYDTIGLGGNPTDQTFLDALKENGVEESSTLTWKPYHWVQNSLKYQFYDNVYMPQEAAEGQTPVPPGGEYPISKNHMLTSQFTYDISVQPIDPILMMISYSHVENYVRTTQASDSGISGFPLAYVPTFNSGDNSWLFSGSYTPLENLTWTNTVCYTISNNYVDFSTGIPLGSSFKELNLSTGLDWTYHQWLKIGPSYEYASYKDNPLEGTGNYSANIFKLNVKFNW